MKWSGSILLGLVSLCVLCQMAHALPLAEPSLDGYVAYQGGRQTFTAQGDGPFPGALFRYVKLEIPNQGGIWLGGGCGAKIGCDLNLFVQGWYLFPNNTEGAILLDPGATPRLIPAGIASHLDWWYVDTFGAYRLNGPFSAVLGFRYDHHNFFTKSPEILEILFAPFAQLLGIPLDLRLDLNALTTVPYFGAQWGNQDPLTLRILYSPFATISAESTLSQNEGILRSPSWLGGKAALTRSQFFEVFGQYSGALSPSVQLAVFCKGTWLQGHAKTSIRETLVGGSSEFDVSFYRVAWNIGVNAHLAFDLPW